MTFARLDARDRAEDLKALEERDKFPVKRRSVALHARNKNTERQDASFKIDSERSARLNPLGDLLAGFSFFACIVCC